MKKRKQKDLSVKIGVEVMAIVRGMAKIESRSLKATLKRAVDAYRKLPPEYDLETGGLKRGINK